MTAPETPPPGSDAFREGLSNWQPPKLPDPPAPYTGLEDDSPMRKPYGPDDFGITPRAIAEDMEPSTTLPFRQDSTLDPQVPRPETGRPQTETRIVHDHTTVHEVEDVVRNRYVEYRERRRSWGYPVPAGFGVVAVALLLALVLFPLPGWGRALLFLVMLVALVAMVLTAIRVLVSAARSPDEAAALRGDRPGD